MVNLLDREAFKIVCGDKTYRIFASGKVEGFDGAPLIIFNRIPDLLADARAEAVDPEMIKW